MADKALDLAIEVAVARRSIIGEGAIWDSKQQRLYWVDILGRCVLSYAPATNEAVELPVCQSVGTVVPRERGGLVVAMHNGFALLDEATGRLTPLADPEPDRPANRFNDGKCDPAGRFWAGTMDYFAAAPDQGSLYCLHADGRVEKKLSPCSISNGIAWSLDHRTMYYVDTGHNNVRAWDYDIDTGAIANERVVVVCETDGHFDGITIDAEGMLWIAVFDGHEVRRYDPRDGRCVQRIRLPVAMATSVALGGADLRDLYITSGSYRFTDADWEAQPLAGSLLRVRVDVPGVPAFAFAG